MQTKFLDGRGLDELFQIGYRNLKKNMNAINDLNVFPVPDGDTGTNMVKTFGGGLHSVGEVPENVGEYMKKLSSGVLLSARGNSGVIFSQFVHGLYRGFENKKFITFADMAYAFECATEDAYKSIITPTEGTILTVIREAAEFLSSSTQEYDFCSGFDALFEQMKKSLAKTPELLPVLKEAGVVDSGGAGLVCFVEGICAHLHGESIEETAEIADVISSAAVSASNFGPDSVLEYGYCTEFILQLMNYKTDIKSFDLGGFVKPLEELGDSIVAVHNDGIVKIHIHSFTPEKVLEYARAYGEFITLKIENMSVQHSEASAPKNEKLKYAIVTVASGEGIVDYFYSIGVNAVIDGGQTSNPSVNAFLDAFEKFDAEHIIVLPNNSNIVLTANQAADMYNKADVRVIPTKSIVEGYSAISMMNLDYDTVDEVIENMSVGLDRVVTCYVTTAIRDTVMDGVEVKKDKYVGLNKKTILCCGDDKLEIAAKTIDIANADRDKEVIIVFYGKNVTMEEAEQLRSTLENEYPFADIGFIEGKQDVYEFIISLE